MVDKAKDKILPPDKLAYTINEFVAATGLSRTFLYAAWARGEGPHRTRVECGSRSKILISREDGVAWLLRFR